MLSQQELYQEALRKITERRQVARTLADETQAKLESDFPDIAMANTALRKAGIDCALAAAMGKDVDAAKKSLHAAQKARDEIFAQTGRSPDCLLPKFSCGTCSDKGIVDGKACNCVRALMRQMRREEIAKTTSLSITKFSEMDCNYYPNIAQKPSEPSPRNYMQLLLADLQEYAEDFNRNSSNLLLFGNSGLGKTHAALAIAGTVLEKGYDVIYISSPDFFSGLENHHFNNNPSQEHALLEAVTEADLLILDDLGTEMVSSFMLSTLYTLLNNRTAAGSPTIFTSNITDTALFEKRYTEKIASRLTGTCEPFQFIGTDIRIIKMNEL